MLFRSKAPLRIGLAGGGTDVSPYSDQFGGAIVNATISLYANATIELTNDHIIKLVAADRNEEEQYALHNSLPLTGKLDLLKGVYNRLQKDYPFHTNGFTLTTFVDVPSGSGLGTSSTLVVAVLGAFAEMLQLTLTNYEIAGLAYQIERKDLNLAGGKQDQFAAVFGGFNYMEFFPEDKVIVSPIKMRSKFLYELENNLLLFYTTVSRESDAIIKEQQSNVFEKKQDSIEAMHQLKAQAHQMKIALEQEKLHDIGQILDFGFTQKKKMAINISTPFLEEIYLTAKNAGATGGKISGAGGGGFMVFYCPGCTKYAVIEALDTFAGVLKIYRFTEKGLSSWTID